MEDTVLFLEEKNEVFFFAKYFESLLHNSSSVARRGRGKLEKEEGEVGRLGRNLR